MSTCEKYQELISRMLDGDLSAREEEDLARHLESCPACAALHSAFSAVSRGIGSELEEPPADLLENVMAGVRREEIRRKNRIPTVIRSVLSVAAAAAVIVGVYWGVNLGKSSQKATLKAAAYESAVLEEEDAPAEEPAEAPALAMSESKSERSLAPQAAAGSVTAAADAVQANALPEPVAEEDAAEEPAAAETEEAAPVPAPELPDTAEAPVWDLSAWDLSLLRDLLGGKPTELDPAELEGSLLGTAQVRDKERLLSVALYSRDGVLYYLDPLREAVYQAELSPAEWLAFLGEDA